MEYILPPDSCLKRWCRICLKEMKLKYNYDSEYRVYDFQCLRCGTIIRVYEEIMESMRDTYMEDGYPLEPLTRDEKVAQALDKTWEEHIRKSDKISFYGFWQNEKK